MLVTMLNCEGLYRIPVYLDSFKLSCLLIICASGLCLFVTRVFVVICFCYVLVILYSIIFMVEVVMIIWALLCL